MLTKNAVSIVTALGAGLLGGCSTSKNVVTEETIAYLTTEGQYVAGKKTWGPPGTRTLSEAELEKAKAKQ